MGEMKRFARQIAREVYELSYTDEQIAENIKRAHPKMDMKYIQAQINEVRKNPKLYKERIH
jgi:hypothetical protein